MVQMRVGWLLMTASLVFFGRWLTHRRQDNARVCQTAELLRVGGQLGWLYYWYPDIYEFNRIRTNLDHLFAAADQWLFGCQPSITFSQWLSGGLWSELFNLGYWSYYPMMALLVLVVFWERRKVEAHPHPLPREGGPNKLQSTLSPSQERENQTASWQSATNTPPLGGDGGGLQTVATVILASFFLYYLVFLLLPVAGPQFYFQAVGVDEILAGHFPALGTYFSSHTEMLPAPGNPDGFFYQLVTHSQAAGERPIAAFPSSHIGVSTIVLLLSRRYVPWLTKYLFPFWFLLCCATVYIQAHYLVDAIAGLLSAPLILAIATQKRLNLMG